MGDVHIGIGDQPAAKSSGIASDDELHQQQEEEEEQVAAEIEIWKYVFGFTEMAVVKCAVELGIADILETQPNKTMSLLHLSSTLHCSPSYLYRILRFLTRRRIFKQLPPSPSQSDDDWRQCLYAQTPLSRLLSSTGEKSMAAFLLFESSPAMLAPWHNLKSRVLGGGEAPFDAAHEGRDVWEYARENPKHGQLLNEAMACDARVAVSAVLEERPEVFDGIGTLVDVGGGDGTALRTILGRGGIRKGINFDLPHVVAAADGNTIENVAGDFFEFVPKADAAFLMWVLHDWGDDECIKILRNCKEATGKVIILEAVIDDDDPDAKKAATKTGAQKRLEDVGLMLDMVMMAHTTTGKERTAREWAFVLAQAGFSRHTITPIRAVQSVIEAYP